MKVFDNVSYNKDILQAQNAMLEKHRDFNKVLQDWHENHQATIFSLSMADIYDFVESFALSMETIIMHKAEFEDIATSQGFSVNVHLRTMQKYVPKDSRPACRNANSSQSAEDFSEHFRSWLAGRQEEMHLFSSNDFAKI